jgi:hypothetical protein
MICVPILSRLEGLKSDFLLFPEYNSSIAFMEEQNDVCFNGSDLIDDQIKQPQHSDASASIPASLKRQSSLTEVEWFGQHVSDISVDELVDGLSDDVSYEALLENVQPHDFGIDNSQQYLLIDRNNRTEPNSQSCTSPLSSHNEDGIESEGLCKQSSASMKSSLSTQKGNGLCFLVLIVVALLWNCFSPTLLLMAMTMATMMINFLTVLQRR